MKLQESKTNFLKSLELPPYRSPLARSGEMQAEQRKANQTLAEALCVETQTKIKGRIWLAIRTPSHSFPTDDDESVMSDGEQAVFHNAQHNNLVMPTLEHNYAGPFAEAYVDIKFPLWHPNAKPSLSDFQTVIRVRAR